jgi:hypothetical protein
VLRQSSGRQAGILSAIRRFREDAPPGAGASLERACRACPQEWQRLVRKVEWTLVHMPLPKLQRLGNEVVPFVYEIGWDDDVRRREWRDPDFDNVIRLVGRSGDHLVRLAGLLRPLVCREWAALVARLNADVLDDPELDRFLFGADRTSLTPVRNPLREIQGGRCFYCADRLSGSSQVDHFVPWARYPDNGIDNLVVAHSRCNGAKRDHLAAAGHVDAWLHRERTSETDLSCLADDLGWPRAPERTVAVARSIYLRLPDEARLWRRGDEFVPVDRAKLVVAFGG